MISDSAGITGPSQAYAIVGNPSPSSAGPLQIVTTQQASYSATIWAAAKNVFSTFTGGATNTVVAKSATGIATAAGEVGSAVKNVATSAGSGIKIGFILLILVGGIILLGNIRRATG